MTTRARCSTSSSRRNGSRRAPPSASGRPMPMATISRSMPTTAASKKIATFHTLRQQLEKREGRFNAALSDFIAPASSGVPDYIGAFVVTAGIGEDVVADRFKNANDDYSSILCKALADRLAEAFAERMHQRVRKEFWGYAPDESAGADQADAGRSGRPRPRARAGADGRLRGPSAADAAGAALSRPRTQSARHAAGGVAAALDGRDAGRAGGTSG